MTNQIYGKGRQKFGEAGINWGTGTGGDVIKAVLVDSADYTVNIDVDEFLSAIASGGRISTSAAFTGKANVLGVFDADNITFTAVTGDSAEALVIYKDTGSAATSPLIAYIDSATGLGVTPNGGDITVTWDNGTNKIFKL